MSGDQSNSLELYRKYRPKKFSELRGQEAAVQTLKQMGANGKIPHCLLLTGPSGCGKTTIARILQTRLKCHDIDFEELNCAGDARGIDTIRDINERMGMRPMGGPVRIWLLDECAKLTTDAQTALLKMLEDTPDHVYFFLATTDPEKLIKTIRTRATEIKLGPVREESMRELLKDIAGREQFSLAEEVADKIIEAAEGSPRKALVLLNQVLQIKEVEHQLAAVSSGVSSAKAIDLARRIFKPGVQWKELAECLKQMDDEPETVRRVVLGYANSILLGGGKLAPLAFNVIDIFGDNLFDSGKAGLSRMCYEVLNG